MYPPWSNRTTPALLETLKKAKPSIFIVWTGDITYPARRPVRKNGVRRPVLDCAVATMNRLKMRRLGVCGHAQIGCLNCIQAYFWR